MKCYVAIILMWAALLMPAAIFAEQPPADPVAAPAVESSGEFTFWHSMPDRDDADEDSVVYEYGFEDGWSGWTSADMTDVPAMWHISEEHAYDDGSSWWCADEDLGGYDNHWLQYLKTPVLDLRNRQNLTLQFMLYYACEDPENGPPDPEDWPQYDAWDGCNVWISTDGGDEWEVLTPTEPEYNYESLFSFGYEWGMGPDIPGWCGFSDGWLEAEFDLSRYARQEVQIRWAFCSDPAWATSDDDDAIGMLVDEMRILAGDDPIWENDGTEVGDMETETMAERMGDFWEITDDNSHTGNNSAHCPIRANLSDALITPPLEVPEEGWYTYFDFWLLCNTVAFDADGDHYLDDYFRVWVSNDDGRSWRSVIYDYGDPQQRSDWYEDWGYYGPDVWFHTGDPNNQGYEEWQWKLNMTQFAGETIKLRWELITDDIMGGNQGSGLWIDDFRMLTTSQKENDVGIEWMHVGYPVSLDAVANCQILVKNHGMATQNDIRKYFRFDDARATPITPWQGELQPDSSETYNFRLNRFPYAAPAILNAYTALVDDEDRTNDTARAPVVIYPEGIYKLGYDNREWPTRWNFNENEGPAVLYTPDSASIEDEFDIYAIEVKWSDAEQDIPVTTTLRIFDDNRGSLGRELYTEQVTVDTTDLYPNTQFILLTQTEELQGLDDDFWVYFNIEREDHWPQMLGRAYQGDEPYWGEGHYYISNGEDVGEPQTGFDVQLHAYIHSSDLPERNLASGRNEIEFELDGADTTETVNMFLFGGGTGVVTLERIEVHNEVFTVEPVEELPIYLDIGEYAEINVTFTAPEDGEYADTVIFHSDDESADTLLLIASYYGIEDEVSPLPLEFSLEQAYPNPFNAMAVIPFSLPHDAEVNLAVFDLSGRKVSELVSGRMSAGHHEVSFNARSLPAGLYIYRLETTGFTAVKKIVLVK